MLKRFTMDRWCVAIHEAAQNTTGTRPAGRDAAGTERWWKRRNPSRSRWFPRVPACCRVSPCTACNGARMDKALIPEEELLARAENEFFPAIHAFENPVGEFHRFHLALGKALGHPDSIEYEV